MNKQLITASDRDIFKSMDILTIGRKVKELNDYFTERKEALIGIRVDDLYDLTEKQVRYFGKYRDTVLDAVNILQQMEKSQQMEGVIERIKDLYANRDIMMEEPNNENE